MMADGVEQVGFAEACIRVDEEWVVVTPRLFRDGESGGVGEPIRLPNHEVVEGVLRNQPRIVDLPPGRIDIVDREGHLVWLRRRQILSGRGSHGGDDREFDLQAECVHGRFLESREVAVPDPAEMEVRWGDET